MPKQKTLTTSERDQRVLELHDQLLEIERRLIPTGLHVFGQPSNDNSRADMLKMVASFDRQERRVRSLVSLVANGLSMAEGHEEVDRIVRLAIETFLKDGATAACQLLFNAAQVPVVESEKVFDLLTTLNQQLETNPEMDSLMKALRGEYIEPGPGADIVQNPSILPTGRNTHAINPYGVPSELAFQRSRRVANSLLERHRAEHGRYPETMALVLWGLDNIKTQGDGVAQALWLLGVRPVRDALNRTTGVAVIPIEDLGRPRIDVVMTVSGIFRDLFSPTVQLLDKAVRVVAHLDESIDDNYVRKHVLAQIETDDCAMDDAAIRVFSNAPGNYGTNVNFMVMDSQWDREETLAELFVTRKCFAYGRDGAGNAIDGVEARVAMEKALARVEAAYQNIDSFEIGITDVDHYFEYLGGVSRAVEQRTQSRPAIYLSDSLSVDVKIRTLEETVRLETRAKTLNPKWYEGMLKHGFRGVAEIENHVTNTFGWSATADAVDDWIYTEVANTFVLDEKMLDRLRELNAHSAQLLVHRLLEANGRGYWETDPALIDKLHEINRSLEDQLEGVA